MSSRRRVGRSDSELAALISRNRNNYESISDFEDSTSPPSGFEWRNINVHEDDILEDIGDVEGETENTGNREAVYEQLRPTFDSAPIDYTERPEVQVYRVPKGSISRISNEYESLDYDVFVNELLIKQEKNTKSSKMKSIDAWIVLTIIGACTGAIAGIIDIAVDVLSIVKYTALKQRVDQCMSGTDDCLGFCLMLWWVMNLVPILLAAMITVYIEPVALGSGISPIKAYLNGIKIPRIVRLKTMVVKIVGVIMSVAGGLAVGKEGPMIHTGAVIAAGVSQGKSTTLKRDANVLRGNRNDHDKQDFVAAGASAGVAAAFGSPIGGMLFALEEGCSFWTPLLGFRLLYCSMISSISLNVVLMAYKGELIQLIFGSLLNFGKFENMTYSFLELPLCVMIGAIGGLIGALFVYLNVKLTIFRMRYIYYRPLKVMEAGLVAMATATIGFMMIFQLNDCKYLGEDPSKITLQLFCGDGEFNVLSALWFQTPELSVRSLFHDPPGSHQMLSLFCVFVCFFFLSCWTYGLSIPSGLFIPSLLTGAAWGRIVGIVLQRLYPNATWNNPGKYALFGAAAHLSGVVRMTISLTVILIEATGVSNFGLPLIIIVKTAKYVGDLFTKGIYDAHIDLQGIPFLPSEPPAKSSHITATDIMNRPVIAFKKVESVGRVVDILFEVQHNGFPIVEDTPTTNGIDSFGRLRGIVLRSHILSLLQQKIFCETQDGPEMNEMTYEMLVKAYPRQPVIDEVNISLSERDYYINFSRYLCKSPYTVNKHATLPQIFRLFRGLGLRHVLVTNKFNEVIGMVTRKDLARYRQSGNVVEELLISQG
ncbi:hypothetical protein CHUAL_007724 [Chamberlinius hualienensis]